MMVKPLAECNEPLGQTEPRDVAAAHRSHVPSLTSERTQPQVTALSSVSSENPRKNPTVTLVSPPTRRISW